MQLVRRRLLEGYLHYERCVGRGIILQARHSKHVEQLHPETLDLLTYEV
jgi:hypothetical protein